LLFICLLAGVNASNIAAAVSKEWMDQTMTVVEKTVLRMANEVRVKALYRSKVCFFFIPEPRVYFTPLFVLKIHFRLINKTKFFF
jgi:hypothetical protein